ncbi:MAG: hypothetical protein RIS03_790 [Pseudomonadota bacterium]|jgi:arsenate reductase
MTQVFGIKNCDTMKKACAWLDQHGIQYEFIDYKKSGVVAGQIQLWCSLSDWKILVNQRGTTWKKIPDLEKNPLDETRAKQLMITYPSLIKRPIVLHKGKMIIGFNEDLFENFFKE